MTDAPAPTFQVRRLDRQHNAQMLEILRESPINSGGLSIVFDRQPDIFAPAELKYEPAVYAGLFEGDRLTGFGLLGLHPANVDGAVQTVMHLTDVYLRPEARRHGHLQRAVPFLFGPGGFGVELGYAIIMRGNKPAEAQVGGRFLGVPMAPLSRFVGELEVRNILLTTRRREDSGVPVRPARPEDIEQLVALLQAEHRDRLFGLMVDRASFVANLTRRPAFGLENYWVTEENGRITGMAAGWDTNSFKQNRVVRYTAQMKAVRALTNLFAPLGGWARLPAPGDILRDVFVTDWAVKDRSPRLLAALLDRLYAEYRSRGYNSLIIGSAAEDPALAATRAFSTVPVRSRIALLTTHPRRLEEGGLNTHLPFIDVALL